MKLDTLANVREVIDHLPKAVAPKARGSMSPNNSMTLHAAEIFATVTYRFGLL
jgi:hypothetical protein